MGLEHFDTAVSFAVIMLLLSMLITILVQCVVALSGLRGWNLHYGVIQLLQQLDPGLKNHAKIITKSILEHPSVAHMPVLVGGRRKATAIRREELLRILKDLAQADSTALEGDAKRAVLAAVTKAGVSDPADLTNRISTLTVELTKMFPTQAQAVQDVVNRGLAKVSQLETQVNAWFDTVMDRTTERFVLYTRWITAALAFVLAIGLQVDSIQLFKQLSSDPELRARLIQSADATLKQAGTVVTDKQTPVAAQAIRAMKDDLEDPGDKDLVAAAKDELITRKDGRDWLIKSFSEPKLKNALQAYDRRFEEVTLNNLKGLEAAFSQVKSSMDQTGIQLILQSNPVPRKRLWWIWLPRLGELITGLFLSLGAPFWFNALRRLANLRPAIAGKAERTAPAAG
jgi:hypothetical protein